MNMRVFECFQAWSKQISPNVRTGLTFSALLCAGLDLLCSAYLPVIGLLFSIYQGAAFLLCALALAVAITQLISTKSTSSVTMAGLTVITMAIVLEGAPELQQHCRIKWFLKNRLPEYEATVNRLRITRMFRSFRKVEELKDTVVWAQSSGEGNLIVSFNLIGSIPRRGFIFIEGSFDPRPSRLRVGSEIAKNWYTFIK